MNEVQSKNPFDNHYVYLRRLLLYAKEILGSIKIIRHNLILYVSYDRNHPM